MKSVFHRISNAFWEVIAPRTCEICHFPIGEIPLHSAKRRFEFMCNSCADSLRPAPENHLLFNRLAGKYSPDDIALSTIIARYAYNDDEVGIAPLLHALKYNGFSRIGHELGRELGYHLQYAGMTNYDAIIPVPIHHARKRERGYNQSEMIARGISEIIPIPVYTKGLVRSRYTISQTLLNAEERKTNLEGLLEIGHDAKTKTFHRVLLVDDVFTTGSTLNSCAQILLSSGVRLVDAATVAAATQ